MPASSETKQFSLTESKHFCMVPWVHMHVWPSGEAFACCMADAGRPIGSTRAQSLAEIWNSPAYREMRRNMLADRPSPACTKCYEVEASTAITTLRKSVNRSYANHWDKVESTSADGSVAKLNMAYMDIRFSNLCNFRCRSCGPTFSSAWYEDFSKAYGDPGHPRALKAGGEAFWREVRPLLDSVEEVYFAGGEPLISEEHYRILDHWESAGKTDVRLRYTTNFSNFRFRGRSILESWSAFRDVRVAASLDAAGPRAEYIRKGTNWAEIEANRAEMLERCPSVYFEITPTLSLYNAHHLPDFHRDWIEKGLLEPSHIRLNLLLEPSEMRAQLLPRSLREETIAKYRAHIAWLEAYGARTGKSVAGAREAMESAAAFLGESGSAPVDGLRAFLAKTEKFDGIRGEKFSAVFPEYVSLAGGGHA